MTMRMRLAQSDLSEMESIGLVNTTNLNMNRIFSNIIPLFSPKEEAKPFSSEEAL